MTDYKKMYLELFNGVSEAIDILQKTQQKTENIYIESEDKPPIILDNYFIKNDK